MNPPPPLQAQGVRVGYGKTTIIDSADFEVAQGTVTTVIGPNGCGKSTLLRALSGLIVPTAGEVLLGGDPLAGLRPKEVAQRLALLPQSPIAPEGLSIADLVAKGRQPYQSWYRQWTAADEEIIREAMERTSVGDFSDRLLEELSGGQRQRAWIAMALAQQTDVLLLDEPTTHLDLSHAVDVLELVRDLSVRQRHTVVLVLHDLSLAARYSDRLVVMKAGAIVAQGPPADVLTSELLRDVFDLDARVFPDPVDGTPTIAPNSRGQLINTLVPS